MGKPQTLRPAEAAETLGMSLRSLYRVIAAGDLPTVRALTPAGPIRIRPEDLAAYIEARAQVTA